MTSVRVGWGRGGRGGGKEATFQDFSLSQGLVTRTCILSTGSRKRTGLVDEVCMLHIFSESLGGSSKLIKYNWHGDLGEFLVNKKMEKPMSKIHSKPTCFRPDITGS